MTSPALDQKALAAALGGKALYMFDYPLAGQPKQAKSWEELGPGFHQDRYCAKAAAVIASLPATESVARRPSTPVLDQIIAFPAGHEFEVSELGKSKTIYNAAQYSYTAGYTQKIRRGRYRRTDKAPPLFASPPSHQGLRADVEFLLDRLDDLERGWDDNEAYRQFASHVAPAMARLRAALQSQPAPSGETK